MIEVVKKTPKKSKIEDEIYVRDMIPTIAKQIEEHYYESEYSYQECNADDYLKMIYLFLIDNFDKEIIATTNDIVSLVHLFFDATIAAEKKNRYFHFEHTIDSDGDDCVHFALMSKKEHNITDIKNLLNAEANPSIN